MDVIKKIDKKQLNYAMFWLGSYSNSVYVSNDEYSSDPFDYELLRRADEAAARGEVETISFDEMLEKAGLTYADIQNPF